MQLIKNIFLIISLSTSSLLVVGCGEADYSLEQVQALLQAENLVGGTVEFTTPDSIIVNDDQQEVITVGVNTNESVTYSIIGGDAQEVLTIDVRTGALSFIERPEYREGESNLYEAIVAVTSADGEISTHTLSIEVVADLSVVDPIVDYVAESVQAVAGSGVITQIQARPADATSSVSYTIVERDAEAFEIDGNGNLSFTEPLPDFESTPGREYQLAVVVTDGYGNSVTTPIIIVVLVNDLDEIRPVIETSNVTIIENSLGSVPIVVSAEGNGVVESFILGGADAEAFDLSDTGILSFKEARDYEVLPRTFNITIQVKDDLGNESDIKAITVNVSDMDEHFSFEGIRDFTPIVGAREIGQITATANTISSGDITYALVQGDDLATIDESGRITFKTEAVATQDFTLQVSAESQINGSLTLSEPFNVTVVTDESSIIPLIAANYLQSSEVRAPIDVNRVITKIYATAQGSSTSVRYETTGADANKFRVDSTGQLFFADAFDYYTPVDVDANNVYEVVIKVIDNNGNVAVTAPIQVRLLEDLTKIAPVITSSTFSVPENQRGDLEILYTTNGTGVVEAYTIVGGEDEALFAIVGGRVQFKVEHDYELPSSDRSTNSYRVEIQARDDYGNVSSSKELIINVTDVDETLIFEGLQSYSQVEGLTTLGSITATPKVAMTATITYSISTGSDLFSINSITGLIMFKSAPVFNINGNNSYTLSVIAQSQFNGSETESFEMTVDVIPSSYAITFDSDQSSLSMEQNTMVSFPMTASSAAGEFLSYSVENATAAGIFTINATSGELTIQSPAYSFTGINTYTAEVVATDTLGNSARRLGSVTINTVNGTPSFTSSSTASISENGRSVLDIAATSPIGESLEYSVAGTDGSLFDIIAGELLFKAAPDYESPDDLNHDNVYEVVLTAVDRYGNSATQDLLVSVTDVADTIDPTPSITSASARSISENSTVVGTLTATSPVGASLSFSVTGGTDSSLFSISASTLSFISAPDFETPADANGNNVYEIVVTASDSNGNSVTQSMLITVTDVADTVDPTPSFTSSATRSISENATTVGTLSATSPVGAALSYTVTGGADSARFSISGDTLSFSSAPDFEVPTDSNGDNVYEVTVTASDTNGNSATQTLLVTVGGVDEGIAGLGYSSFGYESCIFVLCSWKDALDTDILKERTTYTMTLTTASTATITYTLVNSSSSTVFSLSGNILTITTPSVGWSSEIVGTVTVHAEDQYGNSANMNLTIEAK